MLVGVVGFLASEVVLSPVVSGCLRLFPFMWGVGVGWCGRLLGLRSGLCLPLSPVVSGCLPSCGGWVLVGVAAILGPEVVLSPVVSFMWGVGVGWCGRLLGL